MSVASIPAKVKASTRRNKNESLISRITSQNVEDLRSLEMWRGCFAEFVGTFFLAVFTIGVGLTKEGDEQPSLLQVGLGCGLFITVIITTLSTVSGGHVNPAISIGFWLTGQISFVRFVFYSIFQVIGCLVGVAALQALLPQNYEGGLGLLLPGEGVSNHQALGMEMLITAFLVFGTISCVDKHREDLAGSIPLMVGFMVTSNILIAGHVSGGCMNPARAFGPAVILGNMEKQWIYWVGPMVGAAIGSVFYDSLLSTRPISIISRRINQNEDYDMPLDYDVTTGVINEEGH